MNPGFFLQHLVTAASVFCVEGVIWEGIDARELADTSTFLSGHTEQPWNREDGRVAQFLVTDV